MVSQNITVEMVGALWVSSMLVRANVAGLKMIVAQQLVSDAQYESPKRESNVEKNGSDSLRRYQVGANRSLMGQHCPTLVPGNNASARGPRARDRASTKLCPCLCDHEGQSK